LLRKIDHDFPNVPLYAGDQFRADPKSKRFDLSRSEMILAVALTTQSLTEGYELGYLEALKERGEGYSRLLRRRRQDL